ncbi:unnamed protein product [Mytilus coruscus]|uniref:Uncharacterized protein n=1 Tax=Mytilus coruscus TaxID=42192 RepID=A0A6J8EW50_MYTCO|nr:unnamed protein product [Mytilus coruscus]
MIWFRYYIKQRLSPEIKLRNTWSKSNESNELDTLKAGGIYDYIDESKICDLVKLPPIDQTIRSKDDQLPNEISDDNNGDMADNNKDETDEALDDDYLNPYKTIESSEENHRYSRIAVEEDGTSPDGEECNKSDEKILPLPKNDIMNEKDPMETSKYVSMYKPDVCTVDVHRSVSMHETVSDVQPTGLNTNGVTSDLVIP